MPFESFNPGDKKYKSTTDLPEKVRGSFQDLPDGGFIRTSAIEYQQRLTRQAIETPSDNTEIEFSQAEAVRLNDAINRKTSEDIARLEASLGQPLSEEVRKEVYHQNVANLHTPYAERVRVYDEQVSYHNDQINQLVRKLDHLSQTELEELTPQQKIGYLTDIAAFERHVPNAQRPEALDSVAKKLFNGYQRNEELTKLHEQAHQDVLKKLTPVQIIDFSHGLHLENEAEALEFCQKIADSLSATYGIKPVKVYFGDASGEYELAEDGSMGEDRRLKITRTDRRTNWPKIIAHEIAHAHQDQLVESDPQTIETPGLKIEQQWFGVCKKLESVYGREFYRQHYDVLPTEQDAKQAGLDFQERLDFQRGVVWKRWDSLLREQGFPSLARIVTEAAIAQQARQLLESNPLLDGKSLVQALTESDPFIEENELHALFQGKTSKACADTLTMIEANIAKARSILEAMQDV